MAGLEIEPRVRTYQLDQIRQVIGVAIPPHVIRAMTVEENVNYEAGAIIREYRFLMAGKTGLSVVDSPVEVQCWMEYPTTWWDHFKQELFPEWLLKIFPANKTRMPRILKKQSSINITKICPRIDISGENPLAKHLEFSVIQAGDMVDDPTGIEYLHERWLRGD